MLSYVASLRCTTDFAISPRVVQSVLCGEWDKKDERSSLHRRSGYISRMSVSMVAVSAFLRRFAEVVVIRDGPLFIRPLFPLALSQRGFHPAESYRVQGERGRDRESGEEIDPLFRVSHSNATYVRAVTPVS